MRRNRWGAKPDQSHPNGSRQKTLIWPAPDYKMPGKYPDKEVIGILLATLLLDALAKDASPLLQITFHDLNEKEICIVTANQLRSPHA